MTTSVNKSKLLSLAQSFTQDSPELYAILKDLIDAQDGLVRDIEEIIKESQAAREVEAEPPPKPLGFNVETTTRNIILKWENPDTAKVAQFDIRVGTDWGTANKLFRTSSTRAVLDPVTVGMHTYMIRSISPQGVESETSAVSTIVIPEIGDYVVNARTIDNTVLLNWDAPDSIFEIDYYIIQRGMAELGRSSSTFHTITEQVGGDFVYEVIPYDIAGNKGPAVCVDVTVSKPRDYVIDGVITDDLSGTLVNGLKEGNRIFIPVKSETWTQHFSTYRTIQAFIDAGYTYWLEPSASSGTYESVYDFETLYKKRLITFRYNFIPLVGTVDIKVELSYSADNITYSTPIEQTRLFADSIRYVKAKLTFTSAVYSGIIILTKLEALLEVRQIMDQGIMRANLSDTNGTLVAFAEIFLDVSSVVSTVESEQSRYAVVSDIDTNGFRIWVFDDDGSRRTHDVNWIARGTN